MKLSLTALLVAGSFALAPATQAQSFQRQWVPASASWVIHVNLEKIVNTTIVEELGVLDAIRGENDYREMVAQLGMSPADDILSITLFGPRADPDSACALIATNSSIDAALESVRKEVPSNPVTVDGFAMSRWDADGEQIYSYVARNRNSDQRLMIVSNDDQDVAAALRVLRGEVPSMKSSGQLALASPPGAGALFYLAAGEQATNEARQGAPFSNMAKLVRSMVIEIGEDGDEMYAKLTADTASEADASQVAQVAQGAIAMGGILAQNEPDAKPFVDLMQSLAVRADGSSLRVQLRQSTPRLMKLIREQGDGRHGIDLGFDRQHDHDHDHDHAQKAAPKKRDSKTGWR